MSHPPFTVLRPTDDESAAAPELRYLVSLVDREARAGLQRTQGPEGSGSTTAEGTEPEGSGVVVLCASDRVLAGRATFAEIRRRIAAGAEAVAPWSIAELDEPRPVPIYTLRGFEKVELRVLESPPEPELGKTKQAGRWPLVALSATAHRRLGEPGPAELAALLAGQAAGAAGLRVVRAGLCHEFVDYYGEVRADVVPFVPAGVHRVLEIGCGRGSTGALLQRELGCRVTGVDLNPVVAAAAAAVLDRAVAGDVEDPEVVAGLGDGWDALVALELFEHLTDQEAFLATALRLVRPGGRIVLSVPNVGHWSVVEDLLAGRWDYLPIGLLCYTHFRFFTRRTLEDWLARAGCRRFRLVPQHTEPPPWLAGPAGLGGGLEVDPESLRTKGFWVLIDVE